MAFDKPGGFERYSLGALAAFLSVFVLVWFVSPYYLGLLTLVGVYALVTLGLNLFMGYAGQVSLGQAAFVAFGAYTSATLGLKAHVSPWFGMLAGAAVAGFVAYLVSFVALRLRENHLAVATLALGIVAGVFFNEADFFGGSSGLKDVPGFALGGMAFDVRGYALLTWAAVALGLCFAGNLVGSQYGRSLVALSSGELGVAALGIDPRRLKRQVFVVAAVYAGLAGALYASYISYIDSTSFGVSLSVNFVLMSVVGGLRSLWGALIGAAVVVLLGQVLSAVVPALLPSARGDVQAFFFGAILIAMLILLPNGLAAQLRRSPRS